MNRLAEQQEDKIWQQCQAGHEVHARALVPTQLGPMWVYDWDRYQGFAGYCTGQDDISRTIMNTGAWEPEETRLVTAILEASTPGGYVIDVGAHIGWYSILAAKMGFKVVAAEASEENIELLKLNAELAGVTENIKPLHIWIGPDEPTGYTIDKDIELVIIDIEGNERYAVDALADMFERKLIKAAMIEISPTFNDSYPELVERFYGWGYTVEKDGHAFDGNWDFAQSNFIFRRPE